jgi:hypothetical protein
MTEMVDRVAEALRQEFEPYRVFDEGEAERLARAAIQAMREPTSEMACAPDVKEWPDDAKAAWRAMIDVALGVTR